MQVLEMHLAEAVLDFLAVDIQGDDALDSEAFAHLAEQRSRKGFSGTLLVLSCIRICGKDQSDALGTCKVQRVDYCEQHHDMVVDGEAHRILTPVDLHGDVVGHVIDDVDPNASDRLLDFRLHLTVQEPRVFDGNVELGAEELRGALSGRNLLVSDVIDKGHLPEDFLLSHSVPVCKILGKFFVTLFVKTSEVLHNLTGQVFGTRTGDDSQLVRLHYAHRALLGRRLTPGSGRMVLISKAACSFSLKTPPLSRLYRKARACFNR